MNSKLICWYVVFFLAPSISNAQAEKSDLKVVYGIQSLRDVDNIEGAEAKSLLSSTNDCVETFEFELSLNKEEALFKKSNQLLSDDVPEYINSIALAFCHGEQTWYTSVNDDTKYVLTEELGSPLILILDESLNWELTGEKKQHGDYELYKATTLRKEGTRELPIVAWFAKELPYSFGPIGFNGLPGLILELQTANVIFKAKEISKHHIKINIPKSKRELAYQEYYLRLDKEMESIMKKGY